MPAEGGYPRYAGLKYSYKEIYMSPREARGCPRPLSK